MFYAVVRKRNSPPIVFFPPILRSGFSPLLTLSDSLCMHQIRPKYLPTYSLTHRHTHRERGGREGERERERERGRGGKGEKDSGNPAIMSENVTLANSSGHTTYSNHKRCVEQPMN